MKKVLISMGFIALALGATAQVKIKDGSVTGSSTTPNSNAILELESSNKGLLYPRVSLTSLTAPLNGGAMVAGMVVYDTATVAASGITPGLYYNTGTQWVRVANNSASTNTAFVYGTGTPQTAGATCNSGAQNTIYIDTGSTSATLGQTWICDGTNWQNYNAPASTEWYLAGSSTADAGANKTANIARTGSVVIGGTTATVPARVAADTSGSAIAKQFATLTVAGGDASINGITVGKGGGQMADATAIGVNALASAKATSRSNTAVGYNALANATSNFNTGIGWGALPVHATGDGNTALGYAALYAHKTGSYNVGIGNDADYSDTSGTGNTSMGYSAFFQNKSGSYNTVLGYIAAYNQTLGNYNIAIGYSALFPNLSGNYQLNIGNAIYGTGVDSTVTNAANIGINTSAPTSSFQVNGSVSTNISVQSGSYTLKATDYTVVFTGGAAVTATLPSAANISGRMYRIVASGTGTTVTVFSSSGTVMLLPTITTLTGQSAIFQSNGSTWYQVQ